MAGEIDEKLENLLVVETLGEAERGAADFGIDVRQTKRELGLELAGDDVDDL